MKECPKCGRMNQPTRKFCVRCGASMLKPVEPEKPKAEVPAVSETPPAAEPSKPAIPKADSLKRSTDDRWVRPSEVSKDRVRHAEKHTGKTEMEKAMEAFKKAETAGIDEETGEGIVETRMLRASEVRELLDSAESFAAQPELQPEAGTTVEGVPGAPPENVPKAPSPKDIEESLLGAKSGYVEKASEQPSATPEPAPGPAPSTPPTEQAPGTTPQPQAQPPGQQPETVERAKTPQSPGAPSGVTTSAPTPSETAPTKPSQEQVEQLAQAATKKVEALLAKIPRPEYLEDSTIQKIISDFREFNLDLQKFQVELDSFRSQMDEKVRKMKNAEEAKRLQYEGLKDQTKYAKDEWKQAESDRKDSEKERKDEISSREKRIKETKKTIGQVEKALERRVRDLEKERKKD